MFQKFAGLLAYHNDQQLIDKINDTQATRMSVHALLNVAKRYNTSDKIL
jgi:hypothetical protein